jgi:hypothetical protein
MLPKERIDSSLDDFSLQVFREYLLQKNPQDLNCFSPWEAQNLIIYNP